MISAIILAAGMSSRMGFPKQLLEFGNRAFIRIVAENVLASSVEEVLVVTGHLEPEVRAVINDLPVKFIYNPAFAQGQGTSLAAGVKALNEKSSEFLVFMCDQPLVTSLMINDMIEAYKKSDCLALRPVYRGVPGHPVIFNYVLHEELKVLQGDEGAWQILKTLGNKVSHFTVQDEAFVLDVDTPESYEKLAGMTNKNSI